MFEELKLQALFLMIHFYIKIVITIKYFLLDCGSSTFWSSGRRLNFEDACKFDGGKSFWGQGNFGTILFTVKPLFKLSHFKYFQYHEIEKNMMNENEVYLSLADSEDCTSLDCSEKYANKRCPRKCGKHGKKKFTFVYIEFAFKE